MNFHPSRLSRAPLSTSPSLRHPHPSDIPASCRKRENGQVDDESDRPLSPAEAVEKPVGRERRGDRGVEKENRETTVPSMATVSSTATVLFRLSSLLRGSPPSETSCVHSLHARRCLSPSLFFFPPCFSLFSPAALRVEGERRAGVAVVRLHSACAPE